MSHRCTVRHTFDMAPCGRDAIYRIDGTEAFVCRECLRFLTHMPRRLFVPIAAKVLA